MFGDFRREELDQPQPTTQNTGATDCDEEHVVGLRLDRGRGSGRETRVLTAERVPREPINWGRSGVPETMGHLIQISYLLNVSVEKK